MFQHEDQDIVDDGISLPPPPPPIAPVLTFGETIVMLQHRQEYDEFPLFYFIGMTNEGLYQFHIGPDIAFAVFDAEAVRVRAILVIC